MKQTTRRQFCQTIWDYYAAHGRHDLPWRTPGANGAYDAYAIMVSELMLQQTQVSRVIPKYQSFLAQFPDVRTLAEAPLSAVLRAWNGLGYNRRAQYVHAAARRIVGEYAGVVPTQPDVLVGLPGIGPNTAGAIRVYACNVPAIFIETNIRTVYLHHFFAGQFGIADKELLPLIGQTLDRRRPREWYWALMDYGSMLKKTVGNANRASAGYSRQAPFAGSNRQLRGQVLRALATGPQSSAQLRRQLTDTRLAAVLADLTSEGLISRHGQRYQLGSESVLQ